MRGHVAVAEGEPVRPRVVGDQLGGDLERLPGPAPPLLLVHTAPQRVHDGVEVGADPQAVQGDVVRGVADHGDLVGLALVRAVGQVGEQAAQEAGPADAPGEGGDAHDGDPCAPSSRASLGRRAPGGCRWPICRLNSTFGLDSTRATRV